MRELTYPELSIVDGGHPPDGHSDGQYVMEAGAGGAVAGALLGTAWLPGGGTVVGFALGATVGFVGATIKILSD